MKDPDFFIAYLARLITGDWIVKAIGTAAIWVVTYIFPTATLQSSVLGALALIIADTISGMWAAKATKQQITSAKFSRVITKLFGNLLLLATAAVVFNNISEIAPLCPYVIAAILSAILITEAISICENLKRLGVWLPAWVQRFMQDHAVPEDGK